MTVLDQKKDIFTLFSQKWLKIQYDIKYVNNYTIVFNDCKQEIQEI